MVATQKLELAFRGDRLQSIGKDSLIAIEQDHATLRPPPVEGAGELGQDEPRR